MYQLSEIAEQQTVSATHDFGLVNDTKFSQTMNIFFQPDFMIVRSIVYSCTHLSTPGAYTINCDVVNGDIGSFSIENFNGNADSAWRGSTPPMAFKLSPGKVISGNVNFSIRDGAGAATALAGELSIMLEFVKLKQKIPSSK